MTIAEIKTLLAQEPTKEELFEIAQDERGGVQKLYTAYLKRIAAREKELERFKLMLAYENDYWQHGEELVGGVDEAGRGPLAGPMVVAAVILPKNVFISELNDSKQLSAKKREKLYEEVCLNALSIAVNIVSVADIDKYNIYQATKMSMEATLTYLLPKPRVALVDAMPLQIEDMETVSLIHGDALSASIAAASIIAKVTRDRIMIELDSEYPEYCFAGNKGYGSKEHMAAIDRYGPTPWHRRSYEPVKSLEIDDSLKTAGESKLFRIK